MGVYMWGWYVILALWVFPLSSDVLFQKVTNTLKSSCVIEKFTDSTGSVVKPAARGSGSETHFVSCSAAAHCDCWK